MHTKDKKNNMNITTILTSKTDRFVLKGKFLQRHWSYLANITKESK